MREGKSYFLKSDYHLFLIRIYDPNIIKNHLVKERLLILDDLDGHVALLLVIVRLDHLPEGPFAYQRVDLVPVEKALPGLDDVVVVLVVITLKFVLFYLAKLAKRQKTI